MSHNVLLIANGYEDGAFLHHAREAICKTLGKSRSVLFVSYAWPEENQDKYFDLFRSTIEPWGLTAVKLHDADDKVSAVQTAQAIFIGGGNTFRLLASLYSHKGLCQAINHRVTQDGIPYIGISAGAVVATPAILTTGSKPIAYPPTLRALDIVPYMLVPHYDVTQRGVNIGDSRQVSEPKSLPQDVDIWEVTRLPGVPLVVGLPNGSVISYTDGMGTVRGHNGAVLFERPHKRTPVSHGAILPRPRTLVSSIPDSITGPSFIS